MHATRRTSPRSRGASPLCQQRPERLYPANAVRVGHHEPTGAGRESDARGGPLGPVLAHGLGIAARARLPFNSRMFTRRRAIGLAAPTATVKPYGVEWENKPTKGGITQREFQHIGKPSCLWRRSTLHEGSGSTSHRLLVDTFSRIRPNTLTRLSFLQHGHRNVSRVCAPARGPVNT